MAKVSGIAAAVLMLAAAPMVQAVTVTSQDFEDGDTTGWQFDNNPALAIVSDPGANSGGFTKFLGRFDGLKNAEYFTGLSGTQTTVNVKFDLYVLDQWSGQPVIVQLFDDDNNELLFQPDFYSTAQNDNSVYGAAGDAIVSYSLDVMTSSIGLKLLISAFTGPDVDVQSFGIDNLVITDDSVENPGGGNGGVPEPASWALMLGGFGMIGGALRTRRTATVSFT